MESITIIHTYSPSYLGDYHYKFIVPTKILNDSDYKEFTNDSDELSLPLSQKLRPYIKHIINDGINSNKIDAVYFLDKGLVK